MSRPKRLTKRQRQKHRPQVGNGFALHRTGRQTDKDDRSPVISGNLPGVDLLFTGAEVAAIKVILKLGKDDYTRPKSYQHIGLLSMLGKAVERMLFGRLQWNLMLKLQATQHGFTPQRRMEDAL
ncbi:hypothetical protein EVAR_27392_1 [Eumeta japonica]|uniref:Reverse transcriptase domain-containing protein n=1 Tax=Eumeta variegata TaxID=151549 RepID=A0A4C1X302_EUMVA|nr:hypothetical protein EVAR_27392_1 [Eumeta japonica]